MKLLTSIILFILTVVSITNCTLLKKRHSVGYKVEWHKNYKKSNDFVEEKEIPRLESIDNSFESIEDSIQFRTEVIRTTTADPKDKKSSLKHKIDTPKIKLISQLKNTTIDKLIQIKSKEEQSSEKPTNLYSIISLALTIALFVLMALIHLITLTNPFLIVIGAFLLLGAFIFALVANSQITKNPKVYNHLSKIFTLPAIITYFLSYLALIILGVIFIFAILNTTFILFLFVGIIFTFIYFALLSLLLFLSVLSLSKSLNKKEEKPTVRSYENPYER